MKPPLPLSLEIHSLKASMHALVGWIAIWQISPRYIRSQDPDHAIEQCPIILSWSPFSICSRRWPNNQEFNYCPLFVGDIHFSLLSLLSGDSIPFLR